MDVKNCCHHLPGNVECPNPIIYHVCWRNPLRPGEFNGGQSYHRPVCIAHLAPAIDYAIEDAGRVGRVEVRIAALDDHCPVLVEGVA